MNSERLFELALGLTPPWCIERLEFSKNASGQRQLDIYLTFAKGAKFKDEADVECLVYDTQKRTWQHLHFFQHRCFLHARVPRITTSKEQVQQVPVAWARPGSGFTLLFEAFAMSLIENEMPVNKAAKVLGVNPHRLWTIFHYWIANAFEHDDQSQVTTLGVDETSSKKGHKYTFLKNAANLSAKQQAALAELIETYPMLGQAYRLKELFHDFWDFNDKEQGLAFLSYWCAEVEASGIAAFKKFVRTLKSHWSGIIN